MYLDARNLLDENYIATVTVRNMTPANDAGLTPGQGHAAYAGIEVNFREESP